ncbi:unnamed protein product [Miscanthus lutarioriparius]|uniref:Uncharacterized protein n=1 Tax=Miscanthus lutarioriparius TaxID=422564 RepID=A0A811MB81_9POAL|nr:unnamed protein product [Miscanthus lutarioriparius]
MGGRGEQPVDCINLGRPAVVEQEHAHRPAAAEWCDKGCSGCGFMRQLVRTRPAVGNEDPGSVQRHHAGLADGEHLAALSAAAAQHWTRPLPEKMQVASLPSAMVSMSPDSLCVGTSGTAPSPQQAKLPSASTAQAWRWPVATFLKAAGVGVSDGAEAAHAGLAELADAAEEVMAQCDAGEVEGLEAFWEVEPSRCGHSQQVGPWSSERPQTWQPPALSERGEGPVEAAADGAGAVGGELLGERPPAHGSVSAERGVRPHRKSVPAVMACWQRDRRTARRRGAR